MLQAIGILTRPEYVRYIVESLGGEYGESIVIHDIVKKFNENEYVIRVAQSVTQIKKCEYLFMIGTSIDESSANTGKVFFIDSAYYNGNMDTLTSHACSKMKSYFSTLMDTEVLSNIFNMGISCDNNCSNYVVAYDCKLPVVFDTNSFNFMNYCESICHDNYAVIKGIINESSSDDDIKVSLLRAVSIFVTFFNSL